VGIVDSGIHALSAGRTVNMHSISADVKPSWPGWPRASGGVGCLERANSSRRTARRLMTSSTPAVDSPAPGWRVPSDSRVPI
jgi:hypothetical protein